jgi:hypothetical protein
MRKGLMFLLLLISINSFGQKSIYKWNDETCDYESTYDNTKYSEIQLKNCYNLTYNYNFQINHTPSVFKPEDVQRLNLDTLDNDFNSKYKLLKSLDLPKTEYWNELRESILIELEQFYKLSRIAYQGYLDPLVLKDWFYRDSCLNKHTNALIAGKDSLLNDWHELTSILVKNNCCPDKVWEKYNKQYASEKRFEYGKVYVTTFGWWNCAIKHIERSDDKFDWNTKKDKFLKLFIMTETKDCDEP